MGQAHWQGGIGPVLARGHAWHQSSSENVWNNRIRERGNLNDVIVGTAPFILTLFVMIGLIIAFPGIVMWLPNLAN